jgi:hypothetical protein
VNHISATESLYLVVPVTKTIKAGHTIELHHKNTEVKKDWLYAPSTSVVKLSGFH